MTGVVAVFVTRGYRGVVVKVPPPAPAVMVFRGRRYERERTASQCGRVRYREVWQPGFYYREARRG